MQRQQQELAALLDQDGEVWCVVVSLYRQNVYTLAIVQEGGGDGGDESVRGGVPPNATPVGRVHRLRVAPRLRPFLPTSSVLPTFPAMTPLQRIP